MLASPDRQLSLTDPDARSMKARDGGIVVYNVQCALDTQHHIEARALRMADSAPRVNHPEASSAPYFRTVAETHAHGMIYCANPVR